MSLDQARIEATIKQKLVDICDTLGEDARELTHDELIPASGLIDSAGLLELLMWYETHFEMPLKPEEITIDNLGSITLMAEFVVKRKGLA
jgi:D-alanine--poly(phosphoribitol) ligase subunit 2